MEKEIKVSEWKWANYVKKWSEWRYWVPTWYKYWKFKQWIIKDNWKPLKKNWRKTWTTMMPLAEVSLNVWKVVNLMTFWVKEVKSEHNINNWVKAWEPLNVVEACYEVWMSPTKFYYYTKKYPSIKEQYENLREQRREFMKEISEHNINKAITWKMKTLKENEVVNYSFKMLELTDKAYNPKQIIERKVEEVNPERTTEDIIADIASLLR